MKQPLTPLALVARGMSFFPGRTAVADEGERLTYAGLRDHASRLAGGLRALGVRRNDRVAVLAPNTVPAFVSYLGVPLAGAVLVPLNVRLQADDYRYILDHSGSRVLLADPELLPRVRPHTGPDTLRVVSLGEGTGDVPGYESLLELGAPVPFEAGGLGEDDLLSINYTSGTTARPKGVMQTHRNNYLNAVNMLLATGLSRRDVHLHVAPLFHANGWGFIWATLAVGALNVMLPKVDAAEVFRRIEDFRVTWLNATATVLVMLLEGRPAGHRAAGTRVVVAGAAPPAEVIRRVEAELGWAVSHLYGLTETTAFLTSFEEPEGFEALSPEDRARAKACQGIPLPLAGEVRVVRQDLTDVARDGSEMGEVVARGNVIMEGYFRDQETTARALRGGWFHTGDLAVWHPDGSIDIKDRAKDVIISGGENISSLEVEGVLYTHPAVAQAAVVAAPHPIWGETPVAFVVVREGQEAEGGELIRHCRERLSHFKAPTRIVFLPDLPRTASGKVQKYLLRELAR